jgi:hypothetical protein
MCEYECLVKSIDLLSNEEKIDEMLVFAIKAENIKVIEFLIPDRAEMKKKKKIEIFVQYSSVELFRKLMDNGILPVNRLGFFPMTNKIINSILKFDRVDIVKSNNQLIWSEDLINWSHLMGKYNSQKILSYLKNGGIGFLVDNDDLICGFLESGFEDQVFDYLSSCEKISTGVLTRKIKSFRLFLKLADLITKDDDELMRLIVQYQYQNYDIVKWVLNKFPLLDLLQDIDPGDFFLDVEFARMIIDKAESREEFEKIYNFFEYSCCDICVCDGKRLVECRAYEHADKEYNVDIFRQLVRFNDKMNHILSPDFVNDSRVGRKMLQLFESTKLFRNSLDSILLDCGFCKDVVNLILLCV